MRPLTPRQRELLVAAVVGLAYYGMARWVFALIDPDTAGSAFWPAAGMTVAVLLASRREAWPPILAAIVVADLLADASQHAPLSSSVLWATGNALEPVIAVVVLQRLGTTAATTLRSMATTVQFVLVAAVLAPVATGLVGSLGNVIGFGDSLFPTWPRWAAGDGLGVLVLAPVLLLPAPRGRALVRPLAFASGAGLLAVLISNDWHVGWYPGTPYLLVPPLMLAALLDGTWAGALTATAVAVVTNVATGLDSGPFSGASSHDDLIVLQLFLGVMLVTGLLIGALRADLERMHRRATEALEEGLTDPLTRIGNRARLERTLPSLVEAATLGAGVAVLYVDLDGFKSVNDRYGHHAGDLVLRHTAERIVAAVRPGDVVCRPGGDEFVVIAAGVTRAQVALLLDRLDHALTGAVEVEGMSIPLQASVGWSWTENPTTQAAALLHDADKAMFRRKFAGRERAAAQRAASPPTQLS